MSEIKTAIKTMGFCGPSSASEPAEVDVKDGRLLRVRPLDYEARAQGELKRWAIKARGKEFKSATKSEITPFAIASKYRVYSPNRILYPMKRVDWDPHGERNTQNRGVSKYVRISWDEATDLMAEEIQRIKATYGMDSLLIQLDGHQPVKTLHSRGSEGGLMDILGGYCMQARNPDSWEGWYWGAKHIWGCDPVGQGWQNNLFKDVAQNADTVLFWGCDVVTTPWGWGGHFPSRFCFFLSEIGVRQIYVCPDVNYGAAVHADKWIPVLPNTDSALQLAIAYVWITEDLYDKDYIATHAVGFDWFEYHLRGGDDGIEKTPEWAEGVCGVPARIIKAMARSWAKENTSIAHCNGGSFIRSTYSHEPARLEVALLGMQALGHPGRNQFKMMEYQLYSRHETTSIPRSKWIPDLMSMMLPYDADKHQALVPETLIPEAMAGDYDHDNPLRWFGTTVAGIPVEDQFNPRQYPLEGSNRIHMMWVVSPKWTSSWNGGNSWIQSVRSPIIETVVAQHIWMEDDCLFADLILPVNTKFEERDINTDVMSGNYNTVVLEDQCIEPVGESVSDYECALLIAEKLGVRQEFEGEMSFEEKIRFGYEHTGAQEYMDWEEFKEREMFIVPHAEDWEKDSAGFYGFFSDPERYPLLTPSGKLEYYSTRLAEHFPDDQERTPYPHWIEAGETHPDERLTTPRGKLYPFLLVSNHPHWRLHAQLDDCAWFREVQTCKVVGPDGYAYEPVWINPKDAEQLGVKTGDVVRIFNDRGWTMGGVYVTERIRTHTVLQDHGARLDPIEPGISDRGGTNNIIAPKATTSKNCAGEVTSGFLVGIEKVDVFELAKQYPEAFSRPYDPETGPIHFLGVQVDEGKE